MVKEKMDYKPTTYLNKFWVIAIFIYYFFIFVIGLLGSFLLLNAEHFIKVRISIFTLGLCGSISMGLVGSTTYYIRKLYKSCIDIYSKKDAHKNRFDAFIIIGTIFYYLTRPLFSIGFSILIVIGFLAGLFIITPTKIDFGKGFIYITMALSYFTGFLSGQFIRRLESRGEQLLKKILGEKDNEI